MSEYYLAVIDTTQIQSYVFGSNRLRENIGASYLVSQATVEWAREALVEAAPVNNLADETEFNDLHIEDGHLQAEVIYHAGGNFVAIFREEPVAKHFVEILSKRVLRHAPGLQLVAVVGPAGWDNLYKSVQSAFKALDSKKRDQAFSAPLLGLGVTEACRSTGLPAVALSPKISEDETSVYPVSSEVLAKINSVKKANERLEEYLKTPLDFLKNRLGKKVEFPYDFDNLGRSHGEFSFIGVLHADGNGMGKRLLMNGERFADDPRQYIDKTREFSIKLNRANIKALTTIIETLAKSIDPGEKAIIHRNSAGDEIGRINLVERKTGGWYLPVRPVVYGGDDVTLVCDGRLGLSLAVEFLQQFEKATGEAEFPDNKGAASACAGISIVKAHYPFSAAYVLAESLCKSAKKYRKKVLKPESESEHACLDWHFALGGLYGDIETIREREYSVPAGPLTLRPLTLGANPDMDARSWSVVKTGITAFQGPDWFDRRNKVKDLREALRGGSDAVNAFLVKYRPKGKSDYGLPNVSTHHPGFRNGGWSGGLCGYFDAVELADWYVELKEESRE